MAEQPKSDVKSENAVKTTIAARSKYKIVLLGNESVGKSSILTRFMYDHFDTTYAATVGVDFLSKTMYLGDRVVRLQLWDTAGQERFRSLIPSYIRDSAVALLVFDMCDARSFEDVDKWARDVRAEREDEVMLVLVANKSDLAERRVVTPEQVEQKAQTIDAAFTIDTSARTGENVRELFEEVATRLPGVDEMRKQSAQMDVRLSAANATQPAETSCCAWS
ncbi:MAG: GTPase Ryh1 [Cercozoa sp. M6MM]